jgi:hypothetical protein
MLDRGEEAERYTEKSRRSEHTAGPSTTPLAMNETARGSAQDDNFYINPSLSAKLHSRRPKLFCFCECAALNRFSIRQPLNSKGAHYKRWFCDGNLASRNSAGANETDSFRIADHPTTRNCERPADQFDACIELFSPSGNRTYPNRTLQEHYKVARRISMVRWIGLLQSSCPFY